ncbi:MAG: four helix bundle protein [Bacteroidales bacterium]
MKSNALKDKSFGFAVRIVKISRFLIKKNEFIISKQLVRSGTSVGAMVREAEHAESKVDFIHKLAVAQKECNETLFWLELLKETDLIGNEMFISANNDATELMKLLTSIIKTTKNNLIN